MTASISRVLLDRILEAARIGPDREICGLLLGRGEKIVAILPAANVAADPARRFEIDPAVLIAAHRRARDGGEAVLGHYHSHPGGEVVPSSCDAAMAHADGALWLICDATGRHGLWRARGEGLYGMFDPVDLDVDDMARA
ncbi:MAG: M67 family peptidase [Sphingomonadales bacterium]|nr:MAG: M67 family peptidase [Sphingomonadales bacterium]TNF02532.1 MAG: M67 family peptidase [Sphingomonadales bacterium]